MRFDEDEYPPIGIVLEHYGWDVPHDRPGNVKVKCFEHGERNASASVNFDKNVVNCFACGFSGTSISIIMQKEGVEVAEAFRIGKEIVTGSDRGIPAASSSSNAVSRRSRDQRTNRRWVPPRRSAPRRRESR